MALIANNAGGAGFEPVPAGTYIARCVSVIDLGVQATGFGDKEKVYVGWEIPDQRVSWEKDGVAHEGPALIGNRYTNSIHPKSILGQVLVSWRGVPFTEEENKAFDLFSILGAPCMVSIVHEHKDMKTYAKVAAVMRLPQGTQCPPAETELIAYSPMDPAVAGNFDHLPEWQQKLVRAGYKMAEGSNIVGSGFAPQQGPMSPPPGQTIEQAALAAGAPTPAAAHATTGLRPQVPGPDDFDDDIPF